MTVGNAGSAAAAVAAQAALGSLKAEAREQGSGWMSLSGKDRHRAGSLRTCSLGRVRKEPECRDTMLTGYITNGIQRPYSAKVH